MAEMRKRTSMSVLEMGRMLGLGKTESYWLIKKNYFKTILVGNTMRVMIDSFEEWYANQFKYQKVDGTPPGEELKKTTYSMEELGQRLGLKEATAYELVAKGHFDVVDVLGKRRVTKESFERWYASQTDYRTVEDQELDADIMASTYGLPEMARIVPFPVSWTVKMKKKQKETQDILSYHSQAAGWSDKARAKASGGRQPIEECGRTGL